MGRFKYRAGDEEDRQAAMELAGGDLDGADFRETKRELNQQRRRNRRAERKARRKGGDAEDYGFEAFTEQEQDAADYFQDLKKGRNKRIAIAAGAVAATALTAGAAAGAMPGLTAGLGKAGAAVKAAAPKIGQAMKKTSQFIGDNKELIDAGVKVAGALKPMEPMSVPTPTVDTTDYSAMNNQYVNAAVNMGFGHPQGTYTGAPAYNQPPGTPASAPSYVNQSFYPGYQ